MALNTGTNPVHQNSNKESAFSSVDLVGHCLRDTQKVEVFKRALKQCVCPNHSVLDVGTGSGILAMLAAAAGARRVVAVEYDPHIAKIARQNIKNNGYSDRIEVRVADAREVCFGANEQFDVVVMEMLTAGMIDESQVQAVNNLHRRGVLSPEVVFLPLRQNVYLTLAEVDFNVHGFRMNMVLHEWNYLPKLKIADLSEMTLAKSVCFSSEIDDGCDLCIPVIATQRGTMNAIWLSSRATFEDGSFLENTMSLNPPVAIPVDERVIEKGQPLTICLKYRYGAGYSSVIARVD